ncbi:Ctr copper transporter family-domain-containing protein [Lophiotrema nucula]|uniref:Copper transport protein n=1 Tax=Lophiotrema nucula TaxID=690887 RepID=A0A6A5ZDZ2_9PLEO|nr:Ctr copper transporter family-domain-containing protein [Lophiotrema nucula]
MSGMAMATATGAMDMSSDSTMMGMDSMAMTFFTSTSTPLFSMAWTPASTGQYAGTCIFLIAFATIFRAILAIRLNFFDILATHKRRRGDDQVLLYSTDKQSTVRPWRASEAVALAFMDVILGGVGYLLMVAVMTMNVGYFLSVLAGIFLGSLVFGRFMVRSAAH